MELEARHVLVTGGTGSLGRRLVWRILGGELGVPASVTVFSRDEAKQHEMRLRYLNRSEATDEVIYEASRRFLKFRIGDVRDLDALRLAVGRADVIVHAAALKQVPTCEYFPSEAVKTNVGGAENLVRAVRDAGRRIEAVVAISTDKACKPINVMGMSKALMERIVVRAAADHPATRYVGVRNGNVVGTRGSVVPLFRHQIACGGPVTVTLPAMTRFLMTLDQAVDGAFAALRHAAPGEFFVPRAPSARIADLAAVLVGDRAIPIEQVGIRPGEKVHEILVSEEEGYRTAERHGYFVIEPIDGDPGRGDRSRVPVPEYSSERVTLDAPGLRRLIDEFDAEDTKTP